MSEYTKLAGFLHTLSCGKPHLDDMQLMLKARDPTHCYFYLEESLADSERQPDHAIWEGEAKKLCEELSTSPTEAIRLLNVLLDLRRRLDDILVCYPNAEEFAHLVLHDVRH